MSKARKTSSNSKPGLIRQTAAQRRAGRENLDNMRTKINGPQCLGEIKTNQRKLKQMLKPGYYSEDIDIETRMLLADKEIRIIESQNRTNLSLLRFVMPTLKAVEHKGGDGGAIQVGIVRFSDIPTE